MNNLTLLQQIRGSMRNPEPLSEENFYLAAGPRKGSLYRHCRADGRHSTFCEPGCQRIGEDGTCKP